MLVQWYPGHMSKARRMMEEDVKLVDLVIEIVDARCPVSSQNPDIKKIAGNKPILMLFNKSDLADKEICRDWKNYYQKEGIPVVFLNSKNKEGIREVPLAIKNACKEKIEKNLKKGIKNQTIKVMVAGIPNVGKSTFINAFTGRNITKTGDKPGVTVGKQWIKASKDIDLLDTPGILWPKFDDQSAAMNLAYIGSINDEILVVEELAGKLLVYLYDNYFSLLSEKYRFDENILAPLYSDDNEEFVSKESLLLSQVAKVLGCLKKGGELDLFKASNRFLDDFRGGKIGKISLEKPDNE